MKCIGLIAFYLICSKLFASNVEDEKILSIVHKLTKCIPKDETQMNCETTEISDKIKTNFDNCESRNGYQFCELYNYNQISEEWPYKIRIVAIKKIKSNHINKLQISFSTSKAMSTYGETVILIEGFRHGRLKNKLELTSPVVYLNPAITDGAFYYLNILLE